MWTGWVGNDGKRRRPGDRQRRSRIRTGRRYPEILEKAGISWKIYQDAGAGLDAAHFWGWGDDAYIGNYGDNSLLYLLQYQNAADGSPLAEKARTGTNISQSGTLFDIFRQDVRSEQLPQVSWIVAPEAYTEHPNWPANYGAWYISQMLDALTANPEVWSKTVFFIMFDENDGFFDHMVPPTPPQSRAEGISTVDTTNELFTGSPDYPATKYTPGPYGLGVRVPMIVVSPWSKGGWVNSEVFDHTSLIRFIERRFGRHNAGLHGVEHYSVAPRRCRATSLLLSTSPRRMMPQWRCQAPSRTSRPITCGIRITVPRPRPTRHCPSRSRGRVRHARCRTSCTWKEKQTRGWERSSFASAMPARLQRFFTFVQGMDLTGPWTYTVGIGDEVSDSFGTSGATSYDLSVYGPNGFLRSFAGSAGSRSANLSVRTIYDRDSEGIVLLIHNHGSNTEKVKIVDAYSGKTTTHQCQPGSSFTYFGQLEKSFGWYDLTVEVESDASFLRRLAGHVETGRDSRTDPAIAS